MVLITIQEDIKLFFEKFKINNTNNTNTNNTNTNTNNKNEDQNFSLRFKKEEFINYENYLR